MTPRAERALSGLPAEVRDCLRSAGPDFRSAARRDPAGFSGELEALLKSAAGIFGCRPEDALFLTGFDRGNDTPGRLEDALAELRAAEFLAAEGFTEISPVERTASRTADLRASRCGKGYVFEVRRVAGGFGEDAVKRIVPKFRKKSAQARTSARNLGISSGGVVFVEGPPFGREFSFSPRLSAAAAGVYSGVRGSRMHVCLLGRGAAAVFPGWD